MTGRIVKGIAGFYYILAEDGLEYACRAKGIFRKEGTKPLVGDEVELEVLDRKDMEGNLTRILPRKSELIRPAVANVDQAMILMALKDPAPDFLLLDRFLVMMGRQGIPCLVCFNKADLAEEKEQQAAVGIYSGCGYKTACFSALDPSAPEKLKDLLKGKVTVLAGPSGVGKSSLTNALQPGISMETGQISQKLRRGRHTTRHSQLIFLEEGTWLMDSPGFTSLYLPLMKEEELSACFPEFHPLDEECRFPGCLHAKEPDCRVKQEVEEGGISQTRYENYLALLEEIRGQKRY